MKRFTQIATDKNCLYGRANDTKFYWQGCTQDFLVGGKYCAESLLAQEALTREFSWVGDYRQSNTTSEA